MANRGDLTITASCPVGECGGTDDVRLTGSTGEDVYKLVVCSTCGGTYAIKVAVTVSGSVTEYELTA